MDVKSLAVEWSESGDRLMQQVVCVEQRAIGEDAAALRQAVADYDAARARLAAAVTGAPHLFEKPRTQLAAGVSFGLRSRPARVTARPDDLIARLRDAGHSDLVQTRAVVLDADLVQLSARTRRKLEVLVSPAGEDVRIKRLRDDLEDRLPALRRLLP